MCTVLSSTNQYNKRALSDWYIMRAAGGREGGREKGRKEGAASVQCLAGPRGLPGDGREERLETERAGHLADDAAHGERLVDDEKRFSRSKRKMEDSAKRLGRCRWQK